MTGSELSPWQQIIIWSRARKTKREENNNSMIVKCTRTFKGVGFFLMAYCTFQLNIHDAMQCNGPMKYICQFLLFLLHTEKLQRFHHHILLKTTTVLLLWLGPNYTPTKVVVVGVICTACNIFSVNWCIMIWAFGRLILTWTAFVVVVVVVVVCSKVFAFAIPSCPNDFYHFLPSNLVSPLNL